MEPDKPDFISALLREKNSELSSKNLELTRNNLKLKEEIEQLKFQLLSTSQEKFNIEFDRKNEEVKWENTINVMKKVINDLDTEKKQLEKDVKKFQTALEKSKHNECMLVELKYNIEKINEDRYIESESAKEQIDSIIEELGQVRHEKDEILSDKLMQENEVKKCREKIHLLETEVFYLKNSKSKAEIFNWVNTRIDRRNSIKNKQNRVYGPQSSKNLIV